VSVPACYFFRKSGEVAGGVEGELLRRAQDFEQRVGPDLRQQILAQGDCSQFERIADPAEGDVGDVQLADRRRDALDAFAIGWEICRPLRIAAGVDAVSELIRVGIQSILLSSRSEITSAIPRPTPLP